MNCPDCGSWSSVLETRGDRRRRECANGHRFTTVEVLHAETKTPAVLRDATAQWFAAREQCRTCAHVRIRDGAGGERIWTCRKANKHCISAREAECANGQLWKAAP